MSKHTCSCCNCRQHKQKEKRVSSPKDKQPFYHKVKTNRRNSK